MGRRDLGSHSDQIDAGNISPVYIIPNSGDGSILRCPLYGVTNRYFILTVQFWIVLKAFREIHDLHCHKTDYFSFAGSSFGRVYLHA